MKKSLFFLAVVGAVAFAGCRKIESDGQVIVVTQPGGGNSTGQTITLSGRINADTTLHKENTYVLKGLVYMVGNHTMTIEAGTVIKGSYSGSDVAALIITRGSKINAVGTPSDPIVFTSASPNPRSGDWGGIVLCGKANYNLSYNGIQGLFQVEGGIDNANGDGLAGSGDAVVPTPIPTDNSGTMRFVRIEYAGYAYQPDKEINSLTFACVGSGTTIDHIETVYAKDDAYEWFGGSVNCKYLIAYKTQDDDFDTDNGFSGKVQFGLVMRDSLIADVSTSEAFESDNNASGTSGTPKTSAIFCNITAIGPRATLNNIGNPLFRAGAQIRRNSALSIYNSIIMGWPQAILIDASTGIPTDNNIVDSSLRIRYTTLAGNNVNLKYAPGSPATGATDASILAWFTNPYFGNQILTNADDARLTLPFNYASPDPTPFGSGSNNQASNASFTDPKLQDAFFDVVPFRGAIAPSLSSAGTSDANWWKGWTKFNYN